jgi:hypothetical protein
LTPFQRQALIANPLLMGFREVAKWVLILKQVLRRGAPLLVLFQRPFAMPRGTQGGNGATGKHERDAQSDSGQYDHVIISLGALTPHPVAAIVPQSGAAGHR